MFPIDVIRENRREMERKHFLCNSIWFNDMSLLLKIRSHPTNSRSSPPPSFLPPYTNASTPVLARDPGQPLPSPSDVWKHTAVSSIQLNVNWSYVRPQGPGSASGTIKPIWGLLNRVCLCLWLSVQKAIITRVGQGDSWEHLCGHSSSGRQYILSNGPLSPQRPHDSSEQW